jgi:hypothetical protein
MGRIINVAYKTFIAYISIWSIPIVRAVRFECQFEVVQFDGFDQEAFSANKI